MRKVAAVLSLVSVLGPLRSGVCAEDSPPLRALLVTGGCCHDYEGQTKLLTEELSRRARVVWTVARGGSGRDDRIAIYEKEGWWKGFDVVVHNECYGGVADDAYVERIAEAHEKGVAAVMIHCALHSYRNAKTDAWRKCLGMTSRRHEKHRPFTVRVVEKAAEHPILAGFHDGWIPPNGELYETIRMEPTATPLATAFGKDTQKDHVVVWTNRYGKARVFATTIGHHTETMREKVWLDLVARGLLWACDRLTAEGEPQPGYGADAGPEQPAEASSPTGSSS